MLSAAAPQAEPRVKRKKGPKGPNPLSVKKKAPKHGIQEVKMAVATAARVEEVGAGNKRKRQEPDGSGGVSVETELRPKRRRRHKAAARLVEGSST